jgi:hypothetical protein
MTMDAAEVFELGLIPSVGAATWWLSTALPTRIGLGKLLLWASVMLLLQSLLRDLWLLAKARRNAPTTPPRIARCMCVESIVGMTGIVTGLLLFSFGISKPVTMERWSWGPVRNSRVGNRVFNEGLRSGCETMAVAPG